MNNVDWFCWLVIALSVLQLMGVAVLIAKVPAQPELKARDLHPFFVPDDETI